MKLKNLVKGSKAIYKIYYIVGSFVLKFLGCFIKTDEKLALFVVYGGQRYDDSPRFIYEYMKKNSQFSDFKYKWAFISPGAIDKVPEDEKLKIDTLAFYITALKAKYWITNSSVSRGLNFKKKNTVNIMFPHGMTGIKRVGNDINYSNKSFRSKVREKFDYIFLEGKYEKEICANAWNVSSNVLHITGLPRNDELAEKSHLEIEQIKYNFKIPSGKKVILYAPTFREYNKDSSLAVYLKPPFDFDLWKKELGDEYVLLLTAHYEIEKLMDVPKDNDFIINAFKYPYINDLILASDMLISDYSSVIWDYSIIGKPIISYAYDYEQYKTERGLYDGYENIFSHGIMTTESQVISFIKQMDYKAECNYTTNHIRDKYLFNYKNATETCVQLIFNKERDANIE